VYLNYLKIAAEYFLVLLVFNGIQDNHINIIFNILILSTH